MLPTLSTPLCPPPVWFFDLFFRLRHSTPDQWHNKISLFHFSFWLTLCFSNKSLHNSGYSNNRLLWSSLALNKFREEPHDTSLLFCTISFWLNKPIDNWLRSVPIAFLTSKSDDCSSSISCFKNKLSKCAATTFSPLSTTKTFSPSLGIFSSRSLAFEGGNYLSAPNSTFWFWITSHCDPLFELFPIKVSSAVETLLCPTINDCSISLRKVCSLWRIMSLEA